MVLDGSFAHVVAGGLAGTTGAVLTSPLEIVKTRLQSSVTHWQWHNGISNGHSPVSSTTGYATSSSAARTMLKIPPNWIGLQPAMAATCYSQATCSEVNKMAAVSRMSVLQCIRYIRHTEGIRGLFKGLSMTILGVLPSRAFYFGAYVNGQEMLSELLPRGSHGNNCLAAAFAGFVSLTCTNPIWLVKTRMQLDQSPKSQSLSAIRCIRTVWRQNGFLGFYRGIQASYLGIAETSLHFVVYEDLKRRLLRWSRGVDSVVVGVSRADEVFYCSIASTCSKSFATCVCYPHEVLRTRLRQEGNKYRGLFQTFRLIITEEGPRALYRGMLTHFMRQIPNTCIVLTTYEGVLYFFREHKLLL
ncbi:hypothetical protein BOX15_Mlig032264g1 [Macrostomum lignano]|uniref:Uncharacterized protein n=1 Tax=Macrostomum lignano TaxID=282301 RepID=A0A267GD75_9PLAT|nr:hypothetical protein BOX15_Mlig032264g1 [Macrostomum lignano]